MPTQHGFGYYHGVPFSVDMGSQLKYFLFYFLHYYIHILQSNTCKSDCPTYLPLLENNIVIQQPVPLEIIEPSYAKQAVRFITENQDSPFFLYVFYYYIFILYSLILNSFILFVVYYFY